MDRRRRTNPFAFHCPQVYTGRVNSRDVLAPSYGLGNSDVALVRTAEPEEPVRKRRVGLTSASLPIRFISLIRRFVIVRAEPGENNEWPFFEVSTIRPRLHGAQRAFSQCSRAGAGSWTLKAPIPPARNEVALAGGRKSSFVWRRRQRCCGDVS